jgi:hypothetical protein
VLALGASLAALAAAQTQTSDQRRCITGSLKAGATLALALGRRNAACIKRTVSPPAARYCNVHYLVARAAGDARGLPAGVDMLGASLQVEGTWQATAGGPWRPFRIRTNAANGVVEALRSAPGAPAFVADTAAAGATATVRRSLATLYDGVDFAGSSESAQAWQILKNLIASTEISVEPTR